MSRKSLLTPLLFLPRELRDRIYTYITRFTSNLKVVTDEDQRNAQHPITTALTFEGCARLPRIETIEALCNANDQLRDELVTIMLNTFRLMISNSETLKKTIEWLEGIFGGFEAVRHVEMHHFHIVRPAEAYDDFLAKCVNLETIHITDLYLRDVHTADGVFFPRGGQTFRDNPHLEVFRGLQKLRYIKYRPCSTDPWYEAAKVLSLLKLERGQSLRLTLMHIDKNGKAWQLEDVESMDARRIVSDTWMPPPGMRPARFTFRAR